MKKLILLTALLLPLTLFAKIWIVDSNPGSASKDFVNLQEAHDGANAGDTLYLIGSGVNYISAKVNISKRLVMIGPGYFLNNPETQVSLLVAFLRQPTGCGDFVIDFVDGAQGSALIGVTIRGRIRISTNNILIKRNLFEDEHPIGVCLNPRITSHGSNVTIIQNYFRDSVNGQGVFIGAGFSNVKIISNYIHSAGGTAISALNSGVEISNNVMDYGIVANAGIIQNNIFTVNPFLTITGSVFRNNMATHPSTLLPSGNGNISQVSLANIFVLTGTPDGRWKLKDGSPAIGAGFEGVDMGMFGGDEPYVLSGIPPIPTIYQLNAPAVGEKNTGLPITIKAKANN
ncbi:MAG: hypothetical protein KF725_10845 [Cyclobacteriaceae bacterium]|nr:hypothetical protein [Cyclobacteriaceae bacterium]UYN86203.1 MAG: hypothetical protein KIT51_15235 [Cyclobacteriaceae bacterium]